MSTPTLKGMIIIISAIVPSIFFSQQKMVNFGNFVTHSGAEVGLFGDVQNEGVFKNNTGDLYFTGSSLQQVSGNNLIRTGQLFLNNTIKLDNELQVYNLFTFNSGIVNSDRGDNTTEFLHFLSGANYTGASAAKYVNGVVRKTGNTSFSFPVGENGLYRPINIAPPTLSTDHFTGFYSNTDPHTNGYNHGEKEASIDHISNCEYWILDRTNGSSDVTVTLSYDNLGTAGCSGVSDQSDLIVTKWNGTLWENLGNSATTGTVSLGNITTFGNVTSFSPFTLGSTGTNNPLPVELISFQATKKDQDVKITWQTETEINSAYFIIQRSKNFTKWEDVMKIEAAGQSNAKINYKDFDVSPYKGTSYYRLKQVDLDGEFKLSKNNAVKFEEEEEEEEGNFTIYPNPSSSIVTIQFNETSKQLYLTNSQGKKIDLKPYTISISNNQYVLNLENLSNGLYFISNNQQQVSKLIKQ